MIRDSVEIGVFVSLAAALHFGLWWQVPSGDLGSSGEGGSETISLAAVTPSIAAMVTAMDTPPDIETEFDTPEVADPLALAEPQPQVALVTPPSPAQPVAAVDAVAPELPDLSTSGISLPSFQAPPEQVAPPDVPDIAPNQTPQSPARPAELALVNPVTSPQPSRDMPQPPEAMAQPEAVPAQTLPEVAPPPPPPTHVEQATAATPKPQQRPKPQPKAQPKRAAVAEAQPEGKSAQSSGSRAAQQAKGAGSSTKAGTGNSDTASLSNAKVADLKKQWGNRFRARVERRKSMPRGIRETGTANVRVEVGVDGRVLSIALVRSSGIAAFDEAALNAVRRAGRFPKAPKGIGAGPFSFTLPIRFN